VLKAGPETTTNKANPTSLAPAPARLEHHACENPARSAATRDAAQASRIGPARSIAGRREGMQKGLERGGNRRAQRNEGLWGPCGVPMDLDPTSCLQSRVYRCECVCGLGELEGEGERGFSWGCARAKRRRGAGSDAVADARWRAVQGTAPASRGAQAHKRKRNTHTPQQQPSTRRQLPRSTTSRTARARGNFFVCAPIRITTLTRRASCLTSTPVNTHPHIPARIRCTRQAAT